MSTSATLERLRSAAKLAAHHLGLLALLRRARRRERCLVLRYHAVASGDAPASIYAGPDITIPQKLFAAQMRFLQRAYTPMPLGPVVEAIAAGSAPPAGAIVVTLDDGYADNFHNALPVLRALAMPATVYVATEPIDDGPALWNSELRAAVLASRAQQLRVEIGGGRTFALGDPGARQHAIKELTNVLVPVDAALRRRILGTIRHELGVNGDLDLSGVMLTSAQIREMHQAGITIGAHTQTHSNMTLLTREQVREELAGSRQRLEAIIGAAVPDFAFPNTGGRYPHYNDAAASVVREVGFRSGVTSSPGVVTSGSDPFQLPRVGVSPRLYQEAPLAAALERYRLLGEARV